MTLRSPGFVTEPITGPRTFGSAAPQAIGCRLVEVPGSGWEVRRIWVERFGELMATTLGRKDEGSPKQAPGKPRGHDRPESASKKPLSQPASAAMSCRRPATECQDAPRRSRRCRRASHG